MLGHVKRVYTCAYRSDAEFYFERLAMNLGIIWSLVIGSLETVIELRILSFCIRIFWKSCAFKCGAVYCSQTRTWFLARKATDAHAQFVLSIDLILKLSAQCTPSPHAARYVWCFQSLCSSWAVCHCYQKQSGLPPNNQHCPASRRTPPHPPPSREHLVVCGPY